MSKTTQDLSTKQLKMNRMLLLEVIRIAEEENDPRIDEPKRQLKLIEDEIKRREEDEPQDLVVSLETLKLDLDIKK